MDLQDALYRAITGGRSPRTGGSVPSMVKEVSGRFGTKPPPGISDRTWRRLRADPGHGFAKATLDALRAAQRVARVSPARARLLRGSPIIGVAAVVRVSSDERDRRILLSAWLNPGASVRAGDQTGLMSDMLDSFLAGRDGQAAEQFRAACESGLDGGTGSGRSLELVDVHMIRLWPPGPAGGSAALQWQRS